LKATLVDIWADRDMEEPEQGLDPTSKDQQGDQKGTPRVGKRSAELRELGGVVLVDMVEALESWKEEILRRNQRRIIVSRTRGDDRNWTRDLEFRQKRKRLGNRNPRNRRR
jgi:hypothetical protein